MKIGRHTYWAVLLCALLTGPRVNAQSNLLISEFLAANANGLLDENGDSSDWLEIHNAGPTPVNLGGWFLTDDPASLKKWQFPATNVTASAYLVVFASGKDRALAGAPFHTGFNLSAAGGYLALVQPDGLTIASEFSYGQQFTDVPFGPGL